MTKLTRRLFLRAGGGTIAYSLIATTGLGWQGHAAAQAAKPTVPVRFTAGANFSFVNLFVGEGAGIFQKHGIDGRVILFDVAFLGTEAVIAGQAETSATAEFPLVNYLAKGADLIVPAVIGTANELRIVTLTSVAKPEDLVGKRVGLIVGSTAHYGFEQYMKRYQLPKQRISVINVPAAEQIALFVKGDIDAYIWMEPIVSRGLQLMKGKAHVLTPGIEVAVKSRLYLQVMRSWADKNPDALVRMLHALVEANEFIKTNPDRTAQITGKKLNLPPQQIPELMRRSGWDWDIHLDASIADNVFPEVIAWMRENKRLAAEPPNIKRVLAPEYLRRVEASRVTGF
jgi:NitT/TauT family transport system substrate-binding protein